MNNNHFQKANTETFLFTTMQRDNLSFFDEKRNVVKAATEWGCWWQTVQEIHIEVKLPKKTSAKEISVNVKPKRIRCAVKNEIIFEGELYRTVYSDDVIWTIEDENLCIVLTKSDYSVKDDIWNSLLINAKYQLDGLTLHEMRKNLDLERFQIQNPGMDFSKAQLHKHYDKLPGWSNDRLSELKDQNEEKISEN